ncbi:MAG: response regulator transcription factor [Chitinophagales bacterium]|nr:response regulator transcription factor [Chitinophagales bacterium]
MNSPIRTLIIDDEPLARKELRYLLSSYPEIEILGEAKNVTDALEKIQFYQPQLLFLDVNMPGRNGFELLDELKTVPRVVFITAYDKFAVKAFEKNALDYIMKPVKPERLSKTIEKVRKDLETDNKSDTGMNKQIFLKDGQYCYFIKLIDIYLIESLGNYSKFYFDHRSCLMHRSLKQIMEQLPSADFFRVNRRQIINLHLVSNIKTSDKRGLKAILKNGVNIGISIRKAAAFKKITGF